jgi:hypothetical protein
MDEIVTEVITKLKVSGRVPLSIIEELAEMLEKG